MKDDTPDTHKKRKPKIVIGTTRGRLLHSSFNLKKAFKRQLKLDFYLFSPPFFSSETTIRWPIKKIHLLVNF